MADKDNYVQPAIPRLDGFYDHWKMLMENLLRSKDYWEVVEKGIPPLPDNASSEVKKAHDEAKIKDFKAKNYLFHAIERSVLETMMTIDTSKDIWESLQQEYQGSNKVKQATLQALKREFEVLTMKEDEYVNDYFARTLTIAKKMRAQGKKIKEKTVVEKIMRTMTPRFNYVVCSIEQSQDIEKLSIDSLQSSILVQEARMKGKKEEDQALKMSGGSSRGRGRGRGAGRGRGRTGSKEHVECYKCHKFGHYQNEFPNLETSIANDARFEEDEEVILMTASNDKDTIKAWIWFLDSACSTHSCGNKEWFTDLDLTFKETVKVGDGRKLKVEGKGSVKLKIQGIIQVITGVYYVPDLDTNLLSIG